MYMRIGKVTNIYPTTGKVKVMYEDEKNASLPLAMLTMNSEYSMPEVGDRVVTVHMANGSSKGFVFGTYYGGGTQPKANEGYRKDFKGGAFATCVEGEYFLKAVTAAFQGGASKLSLGGDGVNASLYGLNVTIGSGVVSEDEVGEPETEVFLKITEEQAILKALTGITIETKAGPVTLKSADSDASVTIDEETIIKATSVTVQADDIELECSYGKITVEELMKRLERVEDELGLPHTIE